jgi:hypothetical protein
MMGSKNHVHKYQRVKLKPSGKIVYKCMLPDCSHYTRAELVAGKKSICWTCPNEFVLTKALLSQRAKPTCPSCRFKGKKDRMKDDSVVSVIDTRVEDLVNKLLG